LSCVLIAAPEAIPQDPVTTPNLSVLLSLGSNVRKRKEKNRRKREERKGKIKREGKVVNKNRNGVMLRKDT